MTLIAEAQSTDWPAIIAAIFAGLFGLINLIYTLKAKDQAKAAAVSVQESREERSKQIGEVQEKVSELRTEVHKHADAANGYKGDIANATQATQAVAESTQKVAEEVKAMRQEINSQPRNDY